MKFKVAEHIFSIEGLEHYAHLIDKMEVSYSPFELKEKVEYKFEPLIFNLSLCNELQIENSDLVYKASENANFVSLSVYKNNDGYYFEFTQPTSSNVNGLLWMSSDFIQAKMKLDWIEREQWNTFNMGVNLCFLLSTAKYNTVLSHASCVVYNGKAYLFLGKSGTGKSTHSRMWLSALHRVILMNDDHPVIRINEKGQAIAYGSPWSGKTPCYKNISAPIGGIIRISRAPYNKAHRLSMIESYASLMTSFSGMTWEPELADGRDKTIQGIISTVPCWVMECLPNEDAAIVCSQIVTEV